MGLINYDIVIVGLSETRRRGERTIKLQSGDLFYYRGEENSSYGGVGFVIKLNLADHVIELSSISSRVAYNVIKIIKKYSLKIIQVYAPTSSHSDEDVESFFEDISKAMKKAAHNTF